MSRKLTKSETERAIELLSMALVELSIANMMAAEDRRFERPQVEISNFLEDIGAIET